MLPRIAPDSYVVCFRFPKWMPKKIGAIYYIQHPQYGAIVKTLAAIHADGGLEFCGESPHSVSQRALGQLAHHHVIGRVLWAIAPTT